MSIKEKLHQKIDLMTEANLEWLYAVLEKYERLVREYETYAVTELSADKIADLQAAAVASQRDFSTYKP